VIAGIVVLLALLGLVIGGYLLSRRNARDVTPGSPDRVTEDVVHGLMTELEKYRAEAAYWKSTAERLQQELDNR
jgi:uncharacterized protein YneF (UPF0154 family)